MNKQFKQATLGPSRKDSITIELNIYGQDIRPDLMHDNTIMVYTAPAGQSQKVDIKSPRNAAERSLHKITLDNSNNSLSKLFKFNPDHSFLDENTNEYTLTGGEVREWFGAIVGGKFVWRTAY